MLEIKNLCVSYGPIQVIRGIDISVPAGSIVALLGANGAGKTTVLRTVSGLVKPASGEILFEDKKINGLAVHKIVKRGLSHAPEGRHIFSGLSVEENLRAGGYSLKAVTENGNKLSAKSHFDQNLKRVYALFPVLAERKKQAANTLSGGEQQMLAIGRALMASPKLLVLDEPSLGLAPLIIKDIFKALGEIKKEGTTIFIVEQNAFATLKMADYAYVLELGKIVVHGPASELIHDPHLVEAYLGGNKEKKPAEPQKEAAGETAEPAAAAEKPSEKKKPAKAPRKNPDI